MNEYEEDILNYIEKNTFDADERYSIEISKDNKKIIRVKKEDKNIYLGSKYNVSRDISIFKDQIKQIDGKSIFLIWGFGTGEHIMNLLKDLASKNRIIIIEPDERILAENILSGNAMDLLNDPRVVILNYKKGNLIGFLAKNIKDIELGSVQTLVYANYDRVYNEEFSQFNKEFLEYVTNSIIGINTSLHFSKKFFKCFTSNIKTIINSTPVNEFRNRFPDTPAIVVSAGPSLEKNIHLLKSIQDKFIIITGGRTLSALLKKGVRPDFVCSIDPGEPSYDVIKDSINCDVPLVYSEVSNDRLVEEYAGKKVFFKDIDFMTITDELLEQKVDCLEQGGSVAHICISLATYLGCSTVIFIGQDLAYTNNKYHAESASIEITNKIISDDNYIYVEDVFGEKVPTTKVLDFYRKKIEEMVDKHKDIKFINSTEGGANINGTLVQPLRKSILDYSFKKPLDKNLDDILNKKIPTDKKIITKKINMMIKTIKRISKICKEALVYTTKMYNYFDKNVLTDIDFILSRLDKLDIELYKEIDKIESIKKLYAPLVARIMISDEFKEIEGESEKKKGKRISLKSEALYKGLLEIVKEAEIEFAKVKIDLQ